MRAKVEKIFLSYNNIIGQCCEDFLKGKFESHLNSQHGHREFQYDENELNNCVNQTIQKWQYLPIEDMDGITPAQFFQELGDVDTLMEVFKVGSILCDDTLPPLFVDKLRDYGQAAIDRLIELAVDESLISDREENYAISLMAIKVLGNWKEEKAVPELIALLMEINEDNELFMEAIKESLVSIGNKACVPLLSWINNADNIESKQEYLLMALSEVGKNNRSDVLFVENLSMKYPGKRLFENVSFNLNKSERAFILGPNGCGKSTLLKLIIGDLSPVSGAVEYGHNVKPGYFDQELTGLDENNTVIEEAWSSNDNLSEVQVRNTLASFLFKGEDVFKKISVLSGGEKSRVALVKLLLSGNNFLILDEPTNHLDINSREVLEKALLDFDGTILAVSHDRYFINKLSTRILNFDWDTLEDFPGSYSQYLEWKNKFKSKQDISDEKSTPSASKLEYLEIKEQRARCRWLEKQLQETETGIKDIENSIEKINCEMNRAATDHIRLAQLHEEITQLESDLENLYILWESLINEKEEFS
jgi:ABC-type multidrug transport system ATPase subunit